ncbi:MAG: right-handed parallel beta-helix repeat-containing protein, partial [Gammaproteobacteria bacterium]|nr:right-handed parallel beta-helix repeat-containing protein [Gammaproteobacteria bacterium]
LDLSSNTALEGLSFGDNQLTELDVSANTALIWLSFGYNELTSLDVSANTALTWLYCNNNQLTYLNMKNGVTDLLTNFNATGNSLTCIETLDPDYATANWTSGNGNIDAGVSFAVCCSSTDVSNWHVATHGSDTHGCGYQGSPFATIQAGINAASSGDTVTVAAGTYTENINFSGKSIKLIGASAATTIIDGNASGRVVLMNTNESSTTLLKNFTIQNGNASGTNYENYGGGVHIYGADPTLENLIIKDNISTYYGAGLFVGVGAVVTMKNSKIISNDAGSHGGGIYVFYNSNFTMTNVQISGNTTTNQGAGIYTDWDDNIVSLVNCTMGGNTSSANNKYALYWQGGDSKLTIVNTIIWNTGLSGIYMDTDGGWDDQTINVAGSVIQGGIANGIKTDDASSVDQNISGMVTGQDPAFVDASGGDYSIRGYSGAISVGVDQVTFSSTTYTAPTTDLAGSSRPNPANTLLDAGAYENINGIAAYSGDTWYVNANAGLAYGNGSASYPLREIQPAVELAASGNTVYVAPGTYTENVLLEGKDLSILSTGNRDNTIIDANGSGSPITFYGNIITSATVLNGFTLKNGGGSGGYGIYCISSSPTL